MKLSDVIAQKLQPIDKDKKWLATQLGMNYTTLVGKISRDSYNYEEVFRISYLLNIDLNELRDSMLIKKGVIGVWNSEAPQKVTTLKIDRNFYIARKIDLTDLDSAFLTAIDTAVKEILFYLTSTKTSLPQEEIKKMARGGAIFREVNTPAGEYTIALSIEDMPVSVPHIQFSKDSLLPDKDILKTLIKAGYYSFKDFSL